MLIYICYPFSRRANSGIGKELATYVAAKGARLYMLCRSKEKAESAMDEIVQATSNPDIKIVQVRWYDLTDFHATITGTKQIIIIIPRLMLVS
jgi:short-subunit dehydrogenase